MLAACPRFSLGHGVAGQYAKRDGNSHAGAEICQCVADGTADPAVVRGFALDDASESYEGIRFRVEFLTHVRDRSREFPCARTVDHRYLTPVIAKNLVKGPLRAGDEWLHDLRIP